MSLPTHLVDANLAAYGRGDAEGLASTLAVECQIGPLAGDPVATGREACQAAYEKTMAAYPLALTRSLNRIAVGPVVIDHEAAQREACRKPLSSTTYWPIYRTWPHCNGSCASAKFLAVSRKPAISGYPIPR